MAPIRVAIIDLEQRHSSSNSLGWQSGSARFPHLLRGYVPQKGTLLTQVTGLSPIFQIGANRHTTNSQITRTSPAPVIPRKENVEIPEREIWFDRDTVY
jgi:hypothetical protein